MTTKFTVGNMMRAAADAADAANVANAAFEKVRNSMVFQVRTMAADTAMMAEQVAACWSTIAGQVDCNTTAAQAVDWCEHRAANNAGPDDEEFDNRSAVAWTIVGADIKARFMA